MKRYVLLAIIICIFTPVIFTARGQSAALSQAGVEFRHVDIWSDGTRLSGDLFYPKGIASDNKLPAIILCHGWGGLRSHLNQDYAPAFAAAGYVVLTFDYRGWGDSASRLVVSGEMPNPDEKGEVFVRAQAIRELVDPRDQTEDITNCINFIIREPLVHPRRIGLWGTSYGGGHVVYVAAHDKRIKCIVAQVASMDSREIVLHNGGLRLAGKKASLRARGEIDPVPQGVDQIPGLKGTPYLSRMANYRPVEFANQLKVPILIIDAEKEELMDTKKHGRLVYNHAQENVPAKYEVLNGLTHFDIYTKGRDQAIRMAIDWYDKYLKKK